MKLSRQTTSDMNIEGSRSHHWGRTHYFIIENAAPAELEAIDDLLVEAGWKNDACPCYDDNFGCGFHIDVSDVEAFKADYKRLKGQVTAYIVRKLAAAQGEALDATNLQECGDVERIAQIRATNNQYNPALQMMLEELHAEALLTNKHIDIDLSILRSDIDGMRREFSGEQNRSYLESCIDYVIRMTFNRLVQVHRVMICRDVFDEFRRTPEELRYSPKARHIAATLDALPVTGCVCKSSKELLVTASGVYVVWDATRCKRVREITPQQVLNNPDTFTLVDTYRTLYPLPGFCSDSDFPLEMGDAWLAGLMEAPEKSVELPPAINKMYDALHALHFRYVLPELSIIEGALYGTWQDGEGFRREELYTGDDAEGALKLAEEANAAERQHWDDQQRGELEGEARVERWFEEGF